MLKNRIFLGHYLEKRFVNKLQTYKDLITLNKSEKILCDDMTKVLQRIQSFYDCNQNASSPGSLWIGYTHPEMIGAPCTQCIWTTLENEEAVPFGQYWFQIKSIKFADSSIEVQLKNLRPVAETIASSSFICDSGNVIEYLNETLTAVEWRELFVGWRTAINQNTFRFLSEEVTAENFKKCVRLFGLLLVIVFSSLLHLIKYLGEFTLRFIQEFTKFVHVATPVLIVIVNTVGKIFGGLYILLAMMWRDAFGGRQSPNPTQTPYNRPILQNKYPPYRAIQSTSYSRQKLF